MCCVNHEALKIDAATFEAGTYPVGTYDDGEERQIMGNCVICHSTISVVGPSLGKVTVRVGRSGPYPLAWEDLLPEHRYQGTIRFPGIATEPLVVGGPAPCRCPMLVGGGIDHYPGCSRK